MYQIIGITSIGVGLAAMVAAFLWVCKMTKSVLVRTVVIIGFLLIAIGIFSSIYIVSKKNGKRGRDEYFKGVGKVTVESIKEQY